VFTVAGAGVAGLLVWIATQIGASGLGGYWAVYGIIAGAGLTMALSQLVGGWTKWGWPRVSVAVFLIGFLPTLVAAGWVLLAAQPDANWLQRHVAAWSRDIGVRGLVDDLREYLAVLAFGLGLVFGFTFDTAPFRRREPVAAPLPRAEPLADDSRPAADVPSERTSEPIA
jgi:hypothetical protein